MTSFTPEEMEFLKSRGNDVSNVHLKQFELITAIMHFFSNIKNKRVKAVFQLRLRQLYFSYNWKFIAKDYLHNVIAARFPYDAES